MSGGLIMLVFVALVAAIVFTRTARRFGRDVGVGRFIGVMVGTAIVVLVFRAYTTGG